MNSTTLAALLAESTALTDAIASLPDADLDRPTRCEPWSVRDLVGHTVVVLTRVPQMLDAPAPTGDPITPVEYYRPDDRFSDEANRQRVQSGIDVASSISDAAELAYSFRSAVTALDSACRAHPPDRKVLTRHGDVMSLDGFLLTRLVEVVLHGIDVADAIEAAPCTTEEGGNLVMALLAGSAVEVSELGFDTPAVLRYATGRDETPQPELDRFHLDWLTLG